MAYPEERSIFEHLFLPKKRYRGPKFLLATAAGVGVAAVIVVSSLAAGGGAEPSKTSTQPQDLQPSTAGLLGGGGSASSQPLTIPIETASPSATMIVSTTALQAASSTPAPTVVPTTPPTATPVKVQQNSTTPALQSESRDSIPLPTETPTPQQPASLLAVAPTSTTVPPSLVQQATSTAMPTLTATATATRTATPTPPATATKAPLPPATGLNALEQEMFVAHNAARAEKNVRSLAVDADAVAVARFRAREMLEKDYFDHSSPTGNTAAKLLADSAATYNSWAENIAYNMGYSSARTVQVAMYGPDGNDGLMNSPGHYKNIMNSSYGRVGIGVASSGNTFFYAIIFLGP